MELFSFEKLSAYQQAIVLVEEVYKLSGEFPSDEKFALTNQLNRAIVSVPSNIAESCGRTSLKEKIHFIQIAFGSLLESFSQLQIAVKLHYIEEDELKLIKPQFFIVSRLLNALSKSYTAALKESESNKPLNN